MRLFGKGVCLIAFALSLLFGLTPLAAKTYTMKIGLATINAGQHEWAKRYAARINEKSSGRIKAEVYPASQLGSIPRQIEGVQLGTQEVYVGPPAFFVSIHPGFQVLSAPGVFRSTDHLVATINEPDFRRGFLSLGEPRGIKGVSLVYLATTAIVSRKPIRTLGDFKGLKIRVFASPMQLLPMKHVGATGAPMPLISVLPALQQGAIDAVFGSTVIFLPFKYYNVARFLVRTHGAYITSLAGMGRDWFGKLPVDLQALVLAEAEAIEPEINRWNTDFFERGYSTWTDRGGVLTDLSPEDRAEMIRRWSTVGAAVAREKPEIAEIYGLMIKAAKKHPG